MTVGAAGGLNVILKVPAESGRRGDHVCTLFWRIPVVIPTIMTECWWRFPRIQRIFSQSWTNLKQKITPKTKAVIVNTPNNPTGVVYSEETIKKMASIMEAKQKEYGTDIYLISDEPYRELAYDGVEVPYLTRYYANTIVGYSYSKSLSLPGERIGYLVIPG